jgi:signal peptidase II
MTELPFEPAVRRVSNRPGSIVAGMGTFRRASFAARVAVMAASSILVLDLVSKSTAEGALDYRRHYWLIDRVVGLQRTKNRGIAFGLGGDSPLITAAVLLALLLLALIVIKSGVMSEPGGGVAIGAIAGGGIGNLIDRLADGSVTDFVAVGPWPRFNVADAALTCGILMLALIEFRESPRHMT